MSSISPSHSGPSSPRGTPSPTTSEVGRAHEVLVRSQRRSARRQRASIERDNVFARALSERLNSPAPDDPASLILANQLQQDDATLASAEIVPEVVPEVIIELNDNVEFPPLPASPLARTAREPTLASLDVAPRSIAAALASVPVVRQARAIVSTTTGARTVLPSALPLSLARLTTGRGPMSVTTGRSTGPPTTNGAIVRPVSASRAAPAPAVVARVLTNVVRAPAAVPQRVVAPPPASTSTRAPAPARVPPSGAPPAASRAAPAPARAVPSSPPLAARRSASGTTEADLLRQESLAATAAAQQASRVALAKVSADVLAQRQMLDATEFLVQQAVFTQSPELAFAARALLAHSTGRSIHALEFPSLYDAPLVPAPVWAPPALFASNTPPALVASSTLPVLVAPAAQLLLTREHFAMPEVCPSITDNGPSAPSALAVQARRVSVLAFNANLALARSSASAVLISHPGMDRLFVAGDELEAFISDGSADHCNIDGATCTVFAPLDQAEFAARAAYLRDQALLQTAAMGLTNLVSPPLQPLPLVLDSALPLTDHMAPLAAAVPVLDCSRSATMHVIPRVHAQSHEHDAFEQDGVRRRSKLMAPVAFSGADKKAGSHTVSQWLHKMEAFLVDQRTHPDEWVRIADSYLLGKADVAWHSVRTARVRDNLPAFTWLQFCDELLSQHGELFVAQAARSALAEMTLITPLNNENVQLWGRGVERHLATCAAHPGPSGVCCPVDNTSAEIYIMQSLARGGKPGKHLYDVCLQASQRKEIKVVSDLLRLVYTTVAMGGGWLVADKSVTAAVGDKRREPESSVSGVPRVDRGPPRDVRVRPAAQSTDAPRVPRTDGSDKGPFIEKAEYTRRLRANLCGKCAHNDHPWGPLCPLHPMFIAGPGAGR